MRVDQETKKVKFFYSKSSLFRVVLADGAWGGLTPELNIFFALFNTRPPIPQILAQRIQEDGTLGEEIPESRVTKDGILREVEVGVTMTPENVRSLIDFLKGRLEQIDKIKAQIQQSQEQGKQ